MCNLLLSLLFKMMKKPCTQNLETGKRSWRGN